MTLQRSVLAMSEPPNVQESSVAVMVVGAPVALAALVMSAGKRVFARTSYAPMTQIVR